jgi:protocatechuate 3,4-dioxygenase beta subunit
MSESDFTRRRALALGGAAAGAVLGPGLSACSSPSRVSRGSGPGKVPSPAPGDGLCVLNPSVTAGPYHLAGAPFRRDITEGKKGVPLTLRLTVRDEPHACALLKDAAVEVWHCDAWGYYSGYPTAQPGGTVPAAGSDNSGANPRTYLRGFQTTDAGGTAEFATVFPGWYARRAPHIHVRVHTGGRATGGTYAGGRVNWTGQLFFADRYSDEAGARAPYTRHTGTRTRLAQDLVYRGGGTRDGLMHVTGDADKGLLATLTVGIDPTRENTGESTGGDGSRLPESRSSGGTSEAPQPGVPSGGAAASTPPPDSAASASRTPTP